MKIVSVPARRWYDNQERVLDFPERWDVDNLTTPGLEEPALPPEEIKARVKNTITGPTIAEFAQGKKQAVIVFDDMSRPTPVKDVAPYVLGELHKAGLKKEQIRFIWALGSHGTYDMINARKKLGDEIVENYAVYNHDAFQNTQWVGRTPTGVELWFNKEFMSCDVKIGIGCITPHFHVGFGGGAKIILPGVAGIETINQFHNQMYRDPSRVGLGNFEGNIMRDECDAAGDAVGLNFKIDCLINRRGEITNLYTGPFRATHKAGAEEGYDHYGIPFVKDFDIVISNAYAKPSEAALSGFVAAQIVKPGEGTAVLIVDCPEGQVPHYVMRSWGSEYGGRHYTNKLPGSKPQQLKKLICMNPSPDQTFLDLVCNRNDVTVVKSWPEVLHILEKDYPGAARVGVIPDALMQYIKPAQE